MHVLSVHRALPTSPVDPSFYGRREGSLGECAITASEHESLDLRNTHHNIAPAKMIPIVAMITGWLPKARWELTCQFSQGLKTAPESVIRATSQESK